MRKVDIPSSSGSVQDLMAQLDRDLAQCDEDQKPDNILIIQPTLTQRVSYQAAAAFDSVVSFGEDVALDVNAASQDNSFRKFLLYFVMGAFALGFLVSDTSSDSYVVNDAIEYILGVPIDSILIWAIGLGLNLIPNIPWVIAILFIWKTSSKILSPAENNNNQDIEIRNELTLDASSRTTDFEIEQEHEFNLNRRTQRQAVSLVPVSGNHQHRDHSITHTVVDVLMIGAIPAILGAAALWDNINRISLSAGGQSASLGLLIPFSILSAGVLGFAHWRLNSYYFHAAGEEGEDYKFWRHFKRTFVDNIWLQPDLSWKRKLGETWVKLVIIAATGFKGYYSIRAFLEVTGIQRSLPWWGSMLICAIPSLPPMIIEGVTETYCIDALKTLDTSLIHPATKGTLIVGGVIHSIPSALLCASISYQATEELGRFYWLLNVTILSGYGVLLIPWDVLGYYATLVQTPRDHNGKEGQSFDDVVRWIIRKPRRRENYVDMDKAGDSQGSQSGWRFWGRSHASAEATPKELQALPAPAVARDRARPRVMIIRDWPEPTQSSNNRHNSNNSSSEDDYTEYLSKALDL